MKHSESGRAASGPSEMVIVDTFTRLIFGEGGDFSSAELEVIEALRYAEPDVAGDDLGAMGDYLRALGVAEMVELVSRVQHCSAAGLPPKAGGGGGGTAASRAH
ncbi:hypothetical protein [Parahaliea mediterranea]|uniref:MafI family immunity protein n=1 Tax=Parahaliea mediterranea TaxID=651086 RepID=A0A939DCU2_9GAMM|nr:hypothetical protein [Parahaliea mediterranea]MBN7795566.1 hypothetical protein [Parahaliea mediterranea]